MLILWSYIGEIPSIRSSLPEIFQDHETISIQTTVVHNCELSNNDNEDIYVDSGAREEKQTNESNHVLPKKKGKFS